MAKQRQRFGIFEMMQEQRAGDDIDAIGDSVPQNVTLDEGKTSLTGGLILRMRYCRGADVTACEADRQIGPNRTFRQRDRQIARAGGDVENVNRSRLRTGELGERPPHDAGTAAEAVDAGKTAQRPLMDGRIDVRPIHQFVLAIAMCER